MTKRMRHLAASFVIASVVLLASSVMYAQTYTMIHDFGSEAGDPRFPGSALVQGEDGALYGTSIYGGTNGEGTVFKITTAGVLKVLYNFCSQPNCADGLHASSLMLRPDGHFLGVASVGILFDISPTGAFTIIDNNFPLSTPLIIGPDGNFYGTIQGAPSCGSIFRLASSPTGDTIKTVHTFSGAFDTPCEPTALVVGPDGNFYGTSMTQGTGTNCGTFFKMTLTGTVTVLHLFGTPGNTDGCVPNNLTVGNDGNFYGTTTNDTIFQATPSGGFTILHELNGGTDGFMLNAGLIQASDGNFYGAANQGGTIEAKQCFGQDCGTIFEISSAGDFNVVHDFDFTSGGRPTFTPVQNTNGVIYGVAFGGTHDAHCGQLNCGVIYSLNNNLPPFAATVPAQAKVGTSLEILGQGFTASSTVSFNGTPATVKFQSATSLAVTVPTGATTGDVTVTTSTGMLTTNQPFVVVP